MQGQLIVVIVLVTAIGRDVHYFIQYLPLNDVDREWWLYLAVFVQMISIAIYLAIL
jgi:hypothetical protein